MKTNWTIFFDKGVMKAFEIPKKKSFPAVESKDPLIEAARLSALPVEKESVDKVRELIWLSENIIGRKPNHKLDLPEDFSIDRTKEYQIEAEFREEDEPIYEYSMEETGGGISVFRKVLALSSNH